jgi:expansin (peptidoglycan-binding protein)
MGTGTKICGQQLAVTAKGSSTTVIVTVVDMCPSQYCNKGDLDLSQAAFKKLAGSGGLGVGILQVEWSFV